MEELVKGRNKIVCRLFIGNYDIRIKLFVLLAKR